MADDALTSNAAPVQDVNTAPVDDDDEAMPSVQRTRKAILIFVVSVVGLVLFLYFALPQIAGLDETWNRIEDGDPWWLTLAFLFELLAIWAYIAMFRALCAKGREDRIGWRASYEITMAGLAATRLFAAGGAGGVALTAWALRQAGMDRRVVADQMIAFLSLQYAVYAAALVVGGIGLYTGLIPGGGSFSITMIPAIFGIIAFVIVALIARVPEGIERTAARWATHSGRSATWARRLATVPASMASGVRLAIELAKRRDYALVAAVAWWAANIGILWACFRAFGDAPPLGILITGYFIGLLGNLLPLPGGVGGVDGGMIGAFVAFGEPTGLTVVAVLAYRIFAFWLPTIPGAIAYLSLRRTVAKWREDRKEERQALATA